MRTLGEDCTESQDEEVLGDHVHSQAYAQEQRDDESDTGDSISSLDSVDSFLQTHDYGILTPCLSPFLFHSTSSILCFL